jgi:hypothetical protein
MDSVGDVTNKWDGVRIGSFVVFVLSTPAICLPYGDVLRLAFLVRLTRYGG